MIQKFEEHLEHMEEGGGDVGPRREKEKPKIKKRKRNPLSRLIGIDWNPYDETLVQKKGKWHLDYPPADEEEEE